MKDRIIDFFLTLLIPVLVLLHLLITPYTKVEESFNLQATHDILKYGLSPSLQDVKSHFDHFSFPGAVPRTFVGPVVLAGVSAPIIRLTGWQHAQFVVRAVLGLFNAWTLHRYRKGVEKAFGREAGRCFVLLMAGQFHVIFYASRTLPNMFAFGLCTLAFRELLPVSPGAGSAGRDRYQRAIYFLVFAGIVFRSELAMLLATQIGSLLLQGQAALPHVVTSGIKSALLALSLSVPIDSYFWQRLIWPELAGFYYNAIQGKSADWGTSPFHYYFTSSLPKLLLNPVIPTVLIPLSIYLPSSRRAALNLILPSLAFVAIYSLQPHKEARFIIYVVPPLTCAASIAASYIVIRRSKTRLYKITSHLLLLSFLGSFCISIGMLLISSFNYPGGAALTRLHDIARPSASSTTIKVHMDVLSCMTGVTRFLEDQSSADRRNATHHRATWRHSKEENPDVLLTPAFWAHFDYVLAESPERIIGAWDIVDTIPGLAGIQISRPDDAPVDLAQPVAALRLALGEHPGRDADQRRNLLAWGKELCAKVFTSRGLWYGLKLSSSGRIAVYEIAREYMRENVTGGWWVGPRFEGKMRILKKAGRSGEV